MRNTEQPQMAQYNWRTSGAVSHIKKEKTNMNTKQEDELYMADGDTINPNLNWDKVIKKENK